MAATRLIPMHVNKGKTAAASMKERIDYAQNAEHEIDDFINNWKLLAAQPKGLKYYVFKTDKYNRLMNSYGEVCTDFEKATLRSMREVESSANMYYYTEE